MTTLITGGCGYLGSQLLVDLAANSNTDRIRILDNMHSGDHQALMDLPEECRYELMEGDILDPSVLRLALEDVDTVIHLAAIVHTPFSFEDPNWVQQVNSWGTSHLVEACLSQNVDHLVYASSGAVYGPGGPHAENNNCQPNGAYAHSKRQAERTVESARKRGLDSTVLRLGMLFGPAPVTRFEAVANKFAKLAGIQKSLSVYGDGTQTRPLLHIADATDAICWALESRNTADFDCFNVVGRNTSINQLVEVIQSIRPNIDVRHTEQDVRTHFSLELKPERIQEAGWTNQRTIRGGLKTLIDRFHNFTSRQIDPSPEI